MSGEIETPNAPLQFQVKTSAVEWVVRKDSFSRDKVGTRVYSGIFSCGHEKQISFFLQLRTYIPFDDDQICVSLFLKPSRKHVGQIYIKYKVGLIAKDGVEKNVRCANDVFDYENGWGWEKFITLDSLLSKENNYFKNGELTIFCDIQRCVEVPKPTFSDDLSEMLESSEYSGFSDGTLVVRGEELKVHTPVLAFRSPGFRTAFHENKLRSGRLVIDDLDVNGVKGLLKFLYSGEDKDLSDIAELVLPAAVKFGVERLKALCEKELCDKLNLQNVTGLLKLAKLHKADQLKRHALTFLCENYTEVVKNSAFWKLNESNQELFSEVTAALTKMTQVHTGEPLAKRIKLN